MKESVKHFAVGLAALGVGMSAFAESMVQIPSQQGGFKVGIDALYLRPHNTDLPYATLQTPIPRISVDSDQNAILDPNYDWGFYVQIGYLFSCTGNDLTLGYTRFHIDARNSIQKAADEDNNLFIGVLPMATIFSSQDPALSHFEQVTGKAEFDLDAVDLEAGQRFTIGVFDMRMFAGARYVKLDHTFQSLGNANVNLQDEIVFTSVGNQSFSSDFKGIGPRVGVDSRYCFSSGFGLDASLSAALLVGNLTKGYQTQGELNFVTSIIDDAFKSANNSVNRVIPNIDVKLGVDYTYPINRACNKSALVFEAGYQASSYFNAIDHTTIAGPTGTTFAYQSTTTDAAFDGLYLGLKYYA